MKRMRRNVVTFIVLTLVLILVSACASIVNGSTQKIAISSQPAGATIRIYDQTDSEIWDSTTPNSTELKRGNGFFTGNKYRIEISKEGYQTEVVELKSQLNGWYIGGNFLFGGLIGWLIVDPMTGAMWALSPGDVDVRMSEASIGIVNPANKGLFVVLKEDVNPTLWQTAQIKRVL